jgi:hypothetical protein
LSKYQRMILNKFSNTGFPIPFFLITIPKNITFFFLSPHPIPFPYLFHPSYLAFVFIRYFSPFLPLPFSPFHICSLVIAHSAPSFLSFHPIPVFALLVTSSKSRHHFSFSCTLSPQVFRNFLCYTPLILPLLSGFFDSLPSFLLIWSLSLSLSSTFIHLSLLSIFPLLHWHTSSFGSISLSPSSFSFLSNISLVSGTLSFHRFCPQTLPLSFPSLLKKK